MKLLNSYFLEGMTATVAILIWFALKANVVDTKFDKIGTTYPAFPYTQCIVAILSINKDVGVSGTYWVRQNKI